MGSDLKIELNKKEAKKSAYFKGGVLKEREVQSPTAGSEVTLPKEAEPEEVIIDKKFVADKLEKIANILNSTIERSKVFITAQKTMDKKDKKMCTPPPPPNPEKRRAKQRRIKEWQKKQNRRTILQNRTPPSPGQLEKIHYQGGELRRADQVEPEMLTYKEAAKRGREALGYPPEPEDVFFETISKGEFDPTIKVDGCTFESRALEDEARLIARMLTGLSKRAYKEAEAKGKWNGTSTNDAILWLVSEAIELYKAAERNEGSIEEELADVLIMSLSIAGKLEIDIGSEVLAKMEKNKSR